MKNKLDSALQTIKSSKKIGLMTHVVVGYPKPDQTELVIEALVKGGSDIIELQIPFSDPIADGPTIMEACDIALSNGANPSMAMSIMENVTAKYQSTPFIFQSYYNPVLRYGVKRFCADAAGAGASGLIIPDLPPEEEKHEQLHVSCKKHNLSLIRVLSPASTKQRIQNNSTLAESFIYFASRYGVTGSNTEIDPQLSKHITQMREVIQLPIAVGFGISKQEHVKALQGEADIAVVGSAIIHTLEKEKNERKKYQAVERFVNGLR